MYRIKPYRLIWEVVAFVKYSLFLHCCSALRKHLIPCINAAQVPLVDKEACLVCIRGWSKGVHACPVFVYAQHRRGKQMQDVAGLRVKLQHNAILSMVTLPASVCSVLSPSAALSLFSSLPLFLLATAHWLKKWAWPQINPSAYLSDPSGETSPPPSHKHSRRDTADSCRQTDM